MQIIPARVSGTEFDLFVILEEDNITRMREYDPAEVVNSQMGKPWTGLRIRNVVLMYATPEDLATIYPMIQNGDMKAALRHLARGFEYRPESGDSDGQYTKAIERQ